jgi:hypothetical protein
MDADRPASGNQQAPSLAAPREDPRRDDVQRGTPRTAPAMNRSAVGILDADSGRVRRPENTGGMVSNYQPGGNAGPEKREPSAPTSPAVGTASPGAHAVTRPPLPHRRPQQHLAPELREDENTGNTGATAATRSPDEARARFARYQQGWADGRAASLDDTNPNPDQGRNA